jgi:hypothetical protein
LKAKLVAKGYAQEFGKDYTKNFAPVAQWSTLRTVIAIAAALRWPVLHMDVVTAFLNGKLDEEIYMYQPPGQVIKGMEDLVCLLLRSLYGLCQSPRMWYFKFDNHIISTGWQCSSVDPNLNVYQRGKSLVILLL